MKTKRKKGFIMEGNLVCLAPRRSTEAKYVTIGGKGGLDSGSFVIGMIIGSGV